MSDSKVISALKRISAKNGGILHAKAVVDEARKPASPLHSRFEWNDTRAAEAYRIEQARELIRVCVQFIEAGDKKERVDVFVSLETDRKSGGYRETVAVLENEELRKQLLRDALSELNRWQKKYSELKELAEIFRAIERAA